MTNDKKLSRDKQMGIATIVLGVIALASPLAAGDHMLMLLAILVTAAGLARMVWAFRSPSFDKGIWSFLLGVLTLIAGLAIFAKPAMAAEMLAITLMIYLATDGFIEFVWGLTLQGKPGKTWLMMSGIMSILLAFFLFAQMPIPATLVIGVIMGIKLVFIGITMLKFNTTFKAAAKSLSG